MSKSIAKKFSAVIVVALAAILMLPACAFASAIYTDQKAASIAKKIVGRNATVIEIDSDYEKSGLMYEVDLIKGKKNYDVVLRAKDGKLVEYGWEYINMRTQKRTGATKSNAYIQKRAKKEVKKGRILSVKKERDDGLLQYKVKMKKGSKLYALYYNAKTGKLVAYNWKYSNVNLTTNYIGLDRAKAIALEKVPGGSIIKTDFEIDDGVPVYEIEILRGYSKYEIVVHARTGKILEYDTDTFWG